MTGRQPPNLPTLLQDEFPVREDLSEETDEDAAPAQPPPLPKPPVASFRLKNDSDLFGLGLAETSHKDISDEGTLGAWVGWGHLAECIRAIWGLGSVYFESSHPGKSCMVNRPVEHSWCHVAPGSHMLPIP